MTRTDRIKLLHLLRYPMQYVNLPLAQEIDPQACAEVLGPDLPVEVRGEQNGILPELSKVRRYRPVADRLASDLLATYAELTAEEGKQLAEETIGLWEVDRAAYEEWAEELLLHLACLVPGSLAGLHEALIDGGMFYRDELYLGANAQTRDRLIRLLEAPPHDTKAFGPLAWIGDDAVQATFYRWLRSPPAGYPYAGQTAAYFAVHAGWELTSAGRRRDLCHRDCYRLVSAQQAPAGSPPGPVGVITPHDEHCGWCEGRLLMLFDIDLTDPRIRFVASPSWVRLRIAMCARCTGFGTVFTEVDQAGGSRWSRFNVRPDFIGDEGHRFPFPERQLVLGSLRRSPYEAIVLEWGGGSQIGGFPKWEQTPRYPECPKCHRPMVFVGQLETADLDLGEGFTYAFWCADCGMAATNYQQT